MKETRRPRTRMQWMFRRRRDGIAFAARGIALPSVGAFREDTRLETAED